jgi:hypothetical protein
MPAQKALLSALFCLATAAQVHAAPERFNGFDFNAQVVRSSGMPYREFFKGDKPTLKVRPGEEYSIVVRNPLPVRVAVAVSVDGLNSIDGQRTSPTHARKWIIEPYGSLTVSGWQTNSESLRKFVFTHENSSYADWREKREGKAYDKNLGVIGVAWFWNKAELEAALHPPQPFDEGLAQYGYKAKRGMPAAPGGAGAPSASMAQAQTEERAGTGMGNREEHPVTEVAFHADSGMYSLRDVLKIYYEFAQEPSEPLPFISERDEHDRFAPEMPN